MAAATHPREAARLGVVESLNLSGTDFEESFDRLTRLIRHSMGVKIAAFSVVERNRQFFKSIQGLDARETPRDVAFCAHTILRNKIMVVEDTHDDPRFRDNPLVRGEPGIRFYAGIPIHAGNGLPIGTLCAIDDRPHTLHPQHADLLNDLQGILEETLRLRSLSVRDHLTGLYNRSHFEATFEREWRRGQRNRLPLSVLLIDLDHCQSYNEQFGMAAGDTAIKTIANHIASQLRRGGDLAARYGGEEFAVLLPETSAIDAAGVAVHLRESIRKLEIAHPGAPEQVLTVSIGGATTHARQYRLGARSALRKAENALHKAKGDGRNRVVMK